MAHTGKEETKGCLDDLSNHELHQDTAQHIGYDQEELTVTEGNGEREMEGIKHLISDLDSIEHRRGIELGNNKLVNLNAVVLLR